MNTDEKLLTTALRDAADDAAEVWSASTELLNVVDSIKRATGSSYRPSWADGLPNARERLAKHQYLMRLAADRMEHLEAKIKALQGDHG